MTEVGIWFVEAACLLIPLEKFGNTFSVKFENSVLGELDQRQNLNPSMEKHFNEDKRFTGKVQLKDWDGLNRCHCHSLPVWWRKWVVTCTPLTLNGL